MSTHIPALDYEKLLYVGIEISVCLFLCFKVYSYKLNPN